MNDKQDRPNDHLTFSQRQGYSPLPKSMRLEEISDDLRRDIWNVTRDILISMREHSSLSYYFSNEGCRLIERVLGRFLKMPEDEIDTEYDGVLNQFKIIILKNKFFRVLDFVEIFSNDEPYRARSNDFRNRIADSFERRGAAYSFDISKYPFQFFPRTSKEQGEATKQAIEAISGSGMEGAATHLRQAADHINARQFADSVSDSISAVESVARRIAPESRTLGEALKVLENKGRLTNKQLKNGFEKLYAYTNSEQGIRHALLDKDAPHVGLDEAMFMFGACASFAAYLVNKQRQAGGQQKDDH